ncbi:MAG: hypothetical protein ABL995_12480 [Bryobacteraceae bacterium]
MRLAKISATNTSAISGTAINTGAIKRLAFREIVPRMSTPASSKKKGKTAASKFCLISRIVFRVQMEGV